MATQNWWLRQLNVGGTNPNRLWWDSSPQAGVVTQATSVTGWNVGTVAANNYASLNQGLEVSRTTFGTIVLPNTAVPTVDNNYPATALYTPPTLLSSTDSISTFYTYNGYFPAGQWVINFPVIAVTLGGTQDGAVTMRVFKAGRTGTTFSPITELTSALLQGSTVTNLTTAAAQNCGILWTAPAITLNNEFLVCKIAWRILGTGSGNTADVALRFGNGARMISPVFQPREYNIS